MWEKIKRWLRGWEWLTVEQAEAETGIFGPIIAISILGDKCKSLRRRDVQRWARRYGPSIAPSLKGFEQMRQEHQEHKARVERTIREGWSK